MEETRHELDVIKLSLDKINLRINTLKAQPKLAKLADKELDTLINQLIEMKISLKIPGR